MGCFLVSIWKKSEFPSPLPTQTVESRRVRQCQSEAAWLMFPTRAEMGVNKKVDYVRGGEHWLFFWGRRSWKRSDFERREGSLIIPTCARVQWEGRDEAISCLSTGTTKSLYTSVSYFLFWHNQSSKLSRHDRIWQVAKTLAKLDKEEAVRHREGDKLAWGGCVHSPRYLSGIVLLGEAAFVGQNSSLKERAAQSGGENGIYRGSHYIRLYNCKFQAIRVFSIARMFLKIIRILKISSHLTRSA